MVLVSSSHVLLGPLVALGALGLIVLICRWVFSTTERDERTARRLERERAAHDFGLLTPVASAPTRADADLLQGVLAEAGVRATVTQGADGRWSVLVFSADAGRAKQLVG